LKGSSSADTFVVCYYSIDSSQEVCK